MDKLDNVLKELVTQVTRLAFAVEMTAMNGSHVSAVHQPCRCCGSVLILDHIPTTTCPACRTENAR
jgi:hypothetical protein